MLVAQDRLQALRAAGLLQVIENPIAFQGCQSDIGRAAVSAVFLTGQLEFVDELIVDRDHTLQDGQFCIQVHGGLFPGIEQAWVQPLFIPQSSAIFQKNPRGYFLDNP